MKKVLLAGIAALTLAGSTVVYAQHRPWFHGQMRMSPEDRAAFLDARIAAVHAGLKLTADQEKLWPAVEAAVRDFAKQRMDRANARMAAEKNDGDNKAEKPADPVTRLRERADSMAATAASLKKIADAADPLYKTLDDNQKRRLSMLTHLESRGFGAEGWRRHRFERGFDRWERGGRGPDRDRYDHDRGGDQERSGRL
ncbi:Spy/CpxP family protein refolding chaperone [Bradyrhizobium tropiciagri]|uniref:Spy/CpxP family protein refolding chaperone n=1 Tax=Bradyrhizobium tropiciagri TaxID=312253 RepID=UPI001BA627F5|nr:Spy/CpxP family protein refolding chaperone [Bradyrhizobium tropiciagri]MBR0869370.1 Spy/CpxP family protein refolding chaperone [Bradyrhizobium tropiciagri]